MTRVQLAHIVRSVCSILEIDEIWVVGSQSILASFSEDELPILLTVSVEADFFVPDWSQRDENEIEATVGEVSRFAETHGYYADPVSKETVRAPIGWENRVVPFYSELAKGCTAWCLEVHDLAISKLAAGREKDKEYVGTLLENRLVHESALRARLEGAENFTEPERNAIKARLNRVLLSIGELPPTTDGS